jgi:hypothetical protein
LCQPRVIMKMIMKKQMECRLAGETEVLGGNLPQRQFLSITKSHMTRPGFEPRPAGPVTSNLASNRNRYNEKF